jgi:hypothetical protein
LLTGSVAQATWRERFILLADGTSDASESSASDAVSEEPDLDEPIEEGSRRRLSRVLVDPGQPTTVYLAGTHGLLWVSRDGGLTWRRLSRIGLAARSVTQLALSPLPFPFLCAATTRGLSRYDPVQERWQPLTQGTTDTQIHDIAITSSEMWMASDAGLFRAAGHRHPLAPSSDSPSANPFDAFGHEPSIGDVRDAAIRYAETHPGKIASWRRRAQLRAILPELSVSADTNLTDFRHWDAGANPDSLLRGERDMDWTTSVTWKLGDLLWNDDQTAIDVRSRLTVQLRNDIVDEVTRLYFERRRAQLSRSLEPAHDPKARMEAELKIQELTALLDGLTGGEFSKQLTAAEQAQHRGGMPWK